MGTEVSSSIANRQIRRHLLEFWLPTVASVLRDRASVRDELRDEKSFRRRLTDFSMPFLKTWRCRFQESGMCATVEE